VVGGTENVIREHDVFSCDYIGISGIPGGFDAIREFPAAGMEIAQKMKAGGKKLMYHNHNWEYEVPCDDGRSMMEFLSEERPAGLCTSEGYAGCRKPKDVLGRKRYRDGL